MDRLDGHLPDGLNYVFPCVLVYCCMCFVRLLLLVPFDFVRCCLTHWDGLDGWLGPPHLPHTHTHTFTYHLPLCSFLPYPHPHPHPTTTPTTPFPLPPLPLVLPLWLFDAQHTLPTPHTHAATRADGRFLPPPTPGRSNCSLRPRARQACDIIAGNITYSTYPLHRRFRRLRGWTLRLDDMARFVDADSIRSTQRYRFYIALPGCWLIGCGSFILPGSACRVRGVLRSPVNNVC